MALSETQTRNALILAAQGDTVEAIARLVAAPAAEVTAALADGTKRRRAVKSED